MRKIGLFIFSFFLLLLITSAAQTLAKASREFDGDDAVAQAQHAGEDSTAAANLVTFARTLKGIPYRYACAHPEKGFDCSGFVMYVFNHFAISVPRSSSAFTNFGKEVDRGDTRPGDIILFTGTNSSIRKVGHVGIVTEVHDEGVVFIHASSGKVPAVVETAMNPHYKKRFLKVIRVAH
jgi:cell wall-associated NlpC family hydrolase